MKPETQLAFVALGLLLLVGVVWAYNGGKPFLNQSFGNFMAVSWLCFLMIIGVGLAITGGANATVYITLILLGLFLNLLFAVLFIRGPLLS